MADWPPGTCRTCCPDGARDGAPHRTSDRSEQCLKSQSDGDVCRPDSSHYGHLVAYNKGAASSCNKDLRHDNVADAELRLSEVNHEPCRQDLEGNCSMGDPLEPSSIADQETNNQSPETQANVVDVGDVARFGDAQAMNSLQVRIEVTIPAVEANPRGHWQKAGPRYNSVAQVVGRQK